MHINPRGLILLLLSISVISILVRLIYVQSPVADWHSWRQADTAAVARNFLTHGVDVFHPRYDDLSNIQSGKDNPNGWRMVEMPLYQAVGVGVYKLFPQLGLEVSLRLVSIVATAGSVFLLGLLLHLFVGDAVALIGASIYAILPFSMYYGRTILPDSFATFWALLSLVLLASSEDRTKRGFWIILAGLCASISLLVRPMAIFLLFPALALYVKNFSFKRTGIYLVIYALLAGIPLILWRRWILNFPEGIAASDWLFNKGNIRFKGAWFHWLFARRLSELILGYWGLVPFAVGLVSRPQKREGLFSLLWVLGGLSYFVIFAGGNVQHDYYQALIIPIVVWFSAIGVNTLISRNSSFNRISSTVLAVVCIAFMWAFSWFTIRTYFWINHPEIIEAGKAADKLLPKDAKVIAPYNGDTSFLYQTGRQGWPLGFDIDKKIAMGAHYYIGLSSVDGFWEVNMLSATHPVIFKNDTYAILDLTK